MNNTSWYKKYWKYLFVIILYLLYLSDFVFLFLRRNGINLNALPKTPRIICFALCDLVYVIVLILLFRKEIINGLKDLKKHFLERFTLSLECWIIGCLIMTVSSLIISFILKENVSANEQAVRDSIKLAPLYMLFTCSIIAPILEEMVFRRALRGFIKFKWVYIVLSGVIFGLLHVTSTQFTPLHLLYIIPYGSMGCAFAYLYHKTNNITLPIIIHMIHNTILVLAQIIGGLL